MLKTNHTISILVILLFLFSCQNDSKTQDGESTSISNDSIDNMDSEIEESPASQNLVYAWVDNLNIRE